MASLRYMNLPSAFSPYVYGSVVKCGKENTNAPKAIRKEDKASHLGL